MKKFFLIIGLLLTTIVTYLLLSQDTTPQNTSSIKPNVLFTNFHPHGSGGHLTFILSIIESKLNEEFNFAVAVPSTSDIYKTCTALGIKTYCCDYPSRIRDFPKILKK